MKRKLPYMLVLLIILSLWGMFRSVAAAHGGEAGIQSSALPVQAKGDAETLTNPPLIPVTGDTQPGWVLLGYGLVGLGTLALILALLNVANKYTTLSIKRKQLSEKKEHSDA